MLHAWKLELPNPEGGEVIRITAPKPREFEALSDELRRFKGK